MASFHFVAAAQPTIIEEQTETNVEESFGQEILENIRSFVKGYPELTDNEKKFFYQMQA